MSYSCDGLETAFQKAVVARWQHVSFECIRDGVCLCQCVSGWGGDSQRGWSIDTFKEQADLMDDAAVGDSLHANPNADQSSFDASILNMHEQLVSRSSDHSQ